MIENPTFHYRGAAAPTQTWLPLEARSETNRTRLHLLRQGSALFHFGFSGASPSDPVTPRFLLEDGELLLEGTLVDVAEGHQLYLIGHGQVIPKGVVGRITGMATGQGQGSGTDSSFDLEIEAFDPLIAEGITGNTTFRSSTLIVEMEHGGSNPIIYGATIIVGN